MTIKKRLFVFFSCTSSFVSFLFFFVFFFPKNRKDFFNSFLKELKIISVYKFLQADVYGFFSLSLFHCYPFLLERVVLAVETCFIEKRDSCYKKTGKPIQLQRFSSFLIPRRRAELWCVSLYTLLLTSNQWESETHT